MKHRSIAVLVAALACALAADSAAAGSAPSDRVEPLRQEGEASIRIVEDTFQWLDSTEEAVAFEWSARITNSGDQDVRVRVILELVDDDERVVNRDAAGRNNDATEVEVAAGDTVDVRQRGRIAYEVAADVVMLRVRWERVESR